MTVAEVEIMKGSLRLGALIAGLLAGIGCGSDGAGAPPAEDAAAPPASDGGHRVVPPMQDASVAKDAQSDDSGDAAVAVDAGGYAAPHAPLPVLVKSGGPVLDQPKVRPIFFPGYDYTAQVTDFVQRLGETSYWSEATSEYGVGKLDIESPIMLTESAPAVIDDSDIKNWIVNHLGDEDGGMGDWGAPEPHTIYAIFYPSTTTITFGHDMNDASCKTFGGYHDEANVFATAVPYAVVPQCTNFKTLTGIDMVTGAASHEFIEAATDPYPSSAPAFAGVDDPNVAFDFLMGGEDGDLCAQDPTSFYKPGGGFDFTVQRGWSDVAAAAVDGDPCQPGSGVPYFNSTFVTTDTIMRTWGKIPGFKIPLNTSKTIELDLFSTAPTSGPWTVTAFDEQSWHKKDPLLSFSFDKTTGSNGDKIQMTITTLKSAAEYLDGFVVISQLGDKKTYWAGIVDSTPTP